MNLFAVWNDESKLVELNSERRNACGEPIPFTAAAIGALVDRLHADRGSADVFTTLRFDIIFNLRTMDGGYQLPEVINWPLGMRQHLEGMEMITVNTNATIVGIAELPASLKAFRITSSIVGHGNSDDYAPMFSGHLPRTLTELSLTFHQRQYIGPEEFSLDKHLAPLRSSVVASLRIDIKHYSFEVIADQQAFDALQRTHLSISDSFFNAPIQDTLTGLFIYGRVHPTRFSPALLAPLWRLRALSMDRNRDTLPPDMLSRITAWRTLRHLFAPKSILTLRHVRGLGFPRIQATIYDVSPPIDWLRDVFPDTIRNFLVMYTHNHQGNVLELRFHQESLGKAAKKIALLYHCGIVDRDLLTLVVRLTKNLRLTMRDINFLCAAVVTHATGLTASVPAAPVPPPQRSE